MTARLLTSVQVRSRLAMGVPVPVARIPIPRPTSPTAPQLRTVSRGADQ